MVPAVLTDITGDNIEDIIVTSFNSTIFAFDGAQNTQLWNYTLPCMFISNNYIKKKNKQIIDFI